VKGDFSRWSFGPNDNLNGALPQQGKVLLDSDGVKQTLIVNDWQQTAARDWVGVVAGVPASEPDSFLVTKAQLTGGVATVTVNAGRLWADGLLVRLEARAGKTAVQREATWLEPPLAPNEGSAADVAAGVMDVVVLEVWQRAVNGFAMPDKLIEPALGGPDTAEWLQTEFAFRLARLAPGQACGSLKYSENSRGALTATLTPPIVVSADCPVNASGGYSGFEHQLYRVEMLDVGTGPAAFKWSRVNGGLVGRGAFDPATQTIAIDANLAAINSYGQTSFYLEIESYDAEFGFTRIISGATATLNAGVLTLTPAASQGVYPTVPGDVFFRLWDGTALVSAFPKVAPATPNPLENGILLQFDADGPGKYLAGDYWTFAVRAQGIANPETLIDARKPEGVRYRRVPLGEITWASDGAGGFVSSTVEDCRAPLHPISQAQGCCTHRVGDGVESFGEFTLIQKAIDALPASGGEVCILPGRYFENVVIAGRSDIVIHGCGWQTRVASASLNPNGKAAQPAALGKEQKASKIYAVFSVLQSAHVEFRDFAIEAAETEAGVLLDGVDEPLIPTPGYWTKRGVYDARLRDLVITAAQAPAVLGAGVAELRVERCRLAMEDVPTIWPAAFLQGKDIWFQRNQVTIRSRTVDPILLPASVVADLAADAALAAQAAASAGLAGSFNNGHPGGIQIGGPSTDVWVLENEIVGGSRIGVTLGSIKFIDDKGQGTGGWNGVIVVGNDTCCEGSLTITGNAPEGMTPVNAGLLTNIQIHRNRIASLGLCGIGPVAYFDISKQAEIISINQLSITENAILDTVTRAIDTSSTNPLAAFFGCGAVTVPDVAGLILRDNTITNFGENPGVQVSAVFVLLGEGVEVSGNQITETRDWSGTSTQNTNPNIVAGGIVLMVTTPPLFNDPLSNSETPMFEPGVAAVRVSDNKVRVALGQALFIAGFGPTSVVNNHLATGGTVANSTIQLAQTVVVLNLGTSIELADLTNPTTGALYNSAQKKAYSLGTKGGSFDAVSNGTVLFSNNVCQLEARESGEEGWSSLFLFTPDALLFSGNTSWLDAPSEGVRAFTDALLMGGTLQMLGNRLQEPVGGVLVSGIAVGVVNMTMQNISTSCLLCFGAKVINSSNIALIDSLSDAYCARLVSAFGATPANLSP
jgi:Family of unknown function (DUF6519)